MPPERPGNKHTQEFPVSRTLIPNHSGITVTKLKYTAHLHKVKRHCGQGVKDVGERMFVWQTAPV